MEHAVKIPVGTTDIEGNLVVPDHARALVLFAHGSGSSRHSSRNSYVATVLQGAGLGTLLIDLLSVYEEAIDLRTRHLRFDIGLLAERLLHTINWLAQEPMTSSLRVGLFGASTGGGAALVAAARCPAQVSAVVSRGGRPDLAGAALANVQAPTLLIVGSLDTEVIALNRQAAAALHCEHELQLVPGATHLFEEPGTLEQVAQLARAWFLRHLAAATDREVHLARA